jgi:hypothetical protein
MPWWDTTPVRMPQEVRSYVVDRLRSGVAMATIKRELRERGWHEEMDGRPNSNGDRVYRAIVRERDELLSQERIEQAGTPHGDPVGEGQLPTARALAEELVGRTIETLRGRPNVILGVTEREIIVGTGRTPAGAPVPLVLVERALDALGEHGELEISVKSLRHRRSSFIGALLMTLPGVSVRSTSPPRLVLVVDAEDVDGAYRHEVAGGINAWWNGDSAETFWMEITDRPDIGVDLHAPQRDAAGNRSAGYSLIWWVAPGDVVFHYDRNARAISSWSRAVGAVAEAPVMWLSHRAATRRRLGTARSQPGWWLDLEGPFELAQPVTLAELRDASDEIRHVLTELEVRHGGSLYFPFFFYGGKELRPMQPYLNKLPAAVVRLLPKLDAAVDSQRTGAGAASQPTVGAAYRYARSSALPDRREPFSVDPAVVERGLRGHANTQNALAAAVESAGHTPLSPRSGDPNFDLGWHVGDAFFVAEVKSITTKNEEQQLRLGLGQVLRYRHVLHGRFDAVRAVLVAEREPRDPAWRVLCQSLDVLFATPADLPDLFVRAGD